MNSFINNTKSNKIFEEKTSVLTGLYRQTYFNIKLTCFDCCFIFVVVVLFL